MKTTALSGIHLIVDIETSAHLCDASAIEDCLIRAAEACSAKVLGCNTHRFGDGAGVTGVVLLAESHISIHTWPELRFAAVDLFMCGACDPRLALPVLREFFGTDKMLVRCLERRALSNEQDMATPLQKTGSKTGLRV